MRIAATNRESTQRVRRWPVTALSLLLGLSACTTTIESVDRAPADESPAATATENGATEPSATDDPRFELQGELPLTTGEVNALIAFIEGDTGRPFLRPPVIVAQTTEAFFVGLAAEDLDDFGSGAEVTVRTLQALGLTTAGVAEVSEAFQALQSSPEGILGYYDPEIDQLYVPVGSQADDEFRGVLVHELTHALDDQYADLTMLGVLAEQGEETGDYEPYWVLLAVLEGRASSVQNRWRVANDVEQETLEDLDAFADVPPAMVLATSIPYEFGERFIEANGGAAHTWDALENPPSSSEEFITLGTSSNETIHEVPTPAANGPILDEAVFGASDLFVWMLGESLDPTPTLTFKTIDAMDGWAGGRSVLWGDETESCMRIAFAADSATDLDEIREAIELWVARGADRVVESADDLVIATGCAPYIP